MKNHFDVLHEMIDKLELENAQLRAERDALKEKAEAFDEARAIFDRLYFNGAQEDCSSFCELFNSIPTPVRHE